MVNTSTILVVCTTNRPRSLSQIIAQYYVKYLQKQSFTTQFIKLADLPLDFIQTALYDQKGKNKIFNQLASQIEKAQKLIFIVPEYNGSFPGIFKTFIDGLDKNIFRGKKCALVGVSKGNQGAIMALSHLVDIFHHLGMAIYPIQPKLSKIATPTLSSVQEHKGYLNRLREQADGFINF